MNRIEAFMHNTCMGLYGNVHNNLAGFILERSIAGFPQFGKK